jgi:hypothetical protein
MLEQDQGARSVSILLMSAAFKAPIKSTPKLVLLALCDCANDQGECYPSVPTLMEKCSAGERTVQDAIALLEREGYMRREFRTGRSTVYWITDPRNWRTPADSAPPQIPHPTPAVAAPPPPQTAHPTPANGAPRTINEPSIEPSQKQSQPARKRADSVPCPGDVDPQVWGDWLKLRKEKRATVSATVVDGAREQAAKAGMTFEAFLRVWVRRGTQGLEADWLKPNERQQSAYDRKAAEAAKWFRGTTLDPSTQQDYIDAVPLAIR